MISVSITHYNNAHFIKDTLEFIVRCENVSEIIINDDCSKDFLVLKNIVNEIDSCKIKLYQNKENLGNFINKLKTLEYCSNEWAILLDSDNIILPEYVNALMKEKPWNNDIIYHPQHAITFPGKWSKNLDYNRFSGKILDYNSFNEYIDVPSYMINDVKVLCLLNGGNYFVHKKTFLDVMKVFLDTNKGKLSNVDYLMTNVEWLINNKKIKIVENMKYLHRLHKESCYKKSDEKEGVHNTKKFLIKLKRHINGCNNTLEILDIPSKFRPKYKSKYPCYNIGLNFEEQIYDIIYKKKDTIKTKLVYLPIYWTSIYCERRCKNGRLRISDLLDYIEKLDKNKKYFTIVQDAHGVIVREILNDLDILVFSAGGGGLNVREKLTKKKQNREYFIGNTGDHILPLICLPKLRSHCLDKTLKCSFMGRIETHPCRKSMKDILQSDDFIVSNTNNITEYKNLMAKSKYSLCPRGYGYTSFRLYESIFMDSIPVYIWEDKCVLPFQDKFDWWKFALIVESKDIEKIPYIIDSIDEVKYKNMMDSMNEIKKYLTFEFCAEYIINEIS